MSFFQGSYFQSPLGSGNPYSVPCPGQGWKVEAIGDLNGDGHPDILYFSPSTGAREVYFYGGAQGITEVGAVAPVSPALPSTQPVVAIADINGDGQADLMTQGTNSSNVLVNYLSSSPGFTSFTITSSSYMNAVEPHGWVVVGAMDVNGDGYPDLFYMNTSTGEVTVNLFIGTTYQSWTDVEWVSASKKLFISPRIKPSSTSQALLFVGTGTSAPDYLAEERELDAMGLRYDTASASGEISATVELNSMTQAQLNAYQLFIVPGGNDGEIVGSWHGSGYSHDTRQMIQEAVLQGAVSYLGICAGSFVAGDPRVNLMGIVPLPLSRDGNYFDLYSQYYVDGEDPNANTMVELSLPAGSQFGSPMDTFWFDGPQLAGFGSVIAQYPDGTPAVADGYVTNSGNNGFLVLSGLHPEAPVTWFESPPYDLTLSGNPIQTDFSFAASLINAALTKTPLPHF